LGAATLIKIRHLTYTYPSTSIPALVDLSLEIPAGKFCGVVGPNRSGKSTLCYVLTGFAHHFFRGELRGEVAVASLDVTSTPLEELVAFAGLVLENPFNQITGARFTVREEVAFGLENLGVPRGEMNERIDQALDQVGIIDLADRSPMSLSGGEQQRLAIAAILVMQPKLIVLDEPTAQLDPSGSRQVLNVLASVAADHGTTVVLVEHKLEWLSHHADRVILLRNGSIEADGPPSQVLASKVAADIGVHQTRYSLAARKAVETGLMPGNKVIPVTLEQAVGFFQ
jgi:energy-coupling factor transporter ATP-binding protein EcfA2